MQTAHGEAGQSGPGDSARNRKIGAGVQTGEAAGHRRPQRTGLLLRFSGVGDWVLVQRVDRPADADADQRGRDGHPHQEAGPAVVRRGVGFGSGGVRDPQADAGGEGDPEHAAEREGQRGQAWNLLVPSDDQAQNEGLRAKEDRQRE